MNWLLAIVAIVLAALLGLESIARKHQRQRPRQFTDLYHIRLFIEGKKVKGAKKWPN